MWYIIDFRLPQWQFYVLIGIVRDPTVLRNLINFNFQKRFNKLARYSNHKYQQLFKGLVITCFYDYCPLIFFLLLDDLFLLHCLLNKRIWLASTQEKLWGLNQVNGSSWSGCSPTAPEEFGVWLRVKKRKILKHIFHLNKLPKW